MEKELREGNRGRWEKGGMGKGGERGKGIRVGKGGKVKGEEKG
jgi:hypothetical protein